MPRESETDALATMCRLSAELNPPEFPNDSMTVRQLSVLFERLCHQKILLADDYDLETLTGCLEKTWRLDTLIIFAPPPGWPDSIRIVYCELRFRTLAAVQERLEKLYLNDEDYAKLQTLKKDINNGDTEGIEDYNATLGKFETHGDFTFKEKVSWLFVLIQCQEQCSRLKTFCLHYVIDGLSQLEHPATRNRCWQAIAAMLNITDVLKSGYGYAPFQRSAQGIYTEKGHLLNTLSFRKNAETDPANLKLAEQIFNRLQRQTDAKPDKQFLTQVKESQASRALLKQQVKDSIFDPENAVYETDSLKGAYWFKKGFEAISPQQQIIFYSKAIALDANMITAFNNRGNIYASLNNDSLALLDYTTALRIDPYYGPAYLNRGNIYQNHGDYAQALHDYDSAVMFSPDNPRCFYCRAQCYRNLGRFEEAIADFNRVAVMSTERDLLAKSAYYCGLCYSSMQNFTTAIAAFKRALEQDPALTNVYLQCGNIYRQQQEYQKAIAEYNLALSADSANLTALYNRGICYKILLKWEQAEKDFHKITNIDPNQAEAWYCLGTVYWEQRQWNKVINAWDKCLAIDPEYKLAREWLPKARQYTKKRTRKIVIEKLQDQ